MRVDDVYVQQRRLWVRLREEGGNAHAMPCHHTFEAYPHAYLEDRGIAAEPKGPLFRTIRRGTGQLSESPLPQAKAYAMVRRRALATGIGTKIGNHTLRATGIVAKLCGNRRCVRRRQRSRVSCRRMRGARPGRA
jgi:hypothetical protein